MKTTFSRTFSTTIMILFLALILVGTSFQALVEDYLTDSAVADLQQNSDAIASLASAYFSEGSILNRDFMVNLDVASRVSGADTIIFSADGRVLLCSEVLTGCSHQGLRLNENYLARVLENDGDVATGTVPQLYEEPRFVVASVIRDYVTHEALGIVVVSRPTYDTSVIMSKISNIFLMVSMLVMALSFVIMLITVKRQSDPLKQMAGIARSFGHGDLDARVKLTRDYPEEVEDLALAFNNMAQELQKSEYQRKEFVANVSHELKTPMTTISGYVDGILDGTIPAERSRYYLQIVSDETKRLSRLVRSMLDISKLQDQSGIPDSKKVHLDMEELVG